MKRVAILGAGATAAYIYAACARYKLAKIEIDVITKEIPKSPAGAIWFRNIPNDIKSKAVAYTIQFVYLGNSETYLKRQWGSIDLKDYTTSFGAHVDKLSSKGYKPEDVLPLLWNDANIHIKHHKISDEEIVAMASSYDIVFATFPLLLSVAKLSARHLVRIPIIRAKADSNSSNFVIYNGTTIGSMVRISQIYGEIFVEYPSHHVMNYNAVGEHNQMRTAYDIHPAIEVPRLPGWIPDNVVFLGRYAEFKRHKLAHESYIETINILNEVFNV